MDMYISTHTPLAGRDNREDCERYDAKISTHTPLAGRDCVGTLQSSAAAISTHTPLAGRDALFKRNHYFEINFYSHAPRGT